MSGTSPRRWVRRLAVVALVTLSGVAAEAIWVAWRSRDFYLRLAAGTRGWRGRVHVADAELGYAPRPGGSGAHTFPVGPDLPSRYDARGFRVPVGAPTGGAEPHPRVLTLGDSLTYGDACLAEDAFAYRVAEKLGGTAWNAGVPGWGLGSMLLRARRLIPEERPDIVVVQYSNWLVERATRPFAPTYGGLIPVPHYVMAGDGELVLRPPAFETNVFDVPIADYAQRPPTALGYASFLWRVGVPLFAHDDIHGTWDGVRRRVQRSPPADREALAGRVYAELAALARDAGAQLVVVAVHAGPKPAPVPIAVRRLGLPIVDADARLLARLRTADPATYSRAYHHWRGDPPVLVDHHPNPEAHERIAEAIVDEIERSRIP